MMDSSPSSEASKLLEAALEQMDGIIQGAKFDVPQRPTPTPIAAANPRSSVSEALRGLHNCLLRDGGSPVIDLEPDDVEFVFNWLKNNLMFNGGSKGFSRDQASSNFAELEERLMQVENEKDSLHLEVTVLTEQLDRKGQRLADVEELFAAKKELLRKTEQALDRERQQHRDSPSPSSPTNTILLPMQSELAQTKNRCALLEKENIELRRLLGGDRTPKYLPLPSPTQSQSRNHPPSPMSSTPDDSSPVGKREVCFSDPSHNSNRVNNNEDSSRTPRGLKKIFSKVKRSNSGGHIQQQDQQQQQQQPLQRPPTPEQYFRRGGLRSTAGGRLGWNSTSSDENKVSISRKPFHDWSTGVLCVWMDSLGLSCYNAEVQKCVGSGEQLAKMSMTELESKLGMKSHLHRKKLYLAIKSRQEGSMLASPGQDAQGMLDYHWVTRWLDDVGLPQYKDTFFEAKVDGRVLNVLTVDDLLSHLRVTNQLHHLSLKRGIQVLRYNKFAPDCLRRRAVPGEDLSNVSLWTNHRVMEWLKQVDLSEYAPNMRGSGIHGALMVYEPRFTDELLASLLSIPASKTLLRRHLSIAFKELVGKDVIHAKRVAEQDPSFAPLNPVAKAKSRSIGGQFTLKRKKSKSQFDYDDLLCPFDSAKTNQTK